MKDSLHRRHPETITDRNGTLVVNSDPNIMHRLRAGLLEPGECVLVPMLTGSMAPLIPTGSEIEVVRPEASDLHVGRIVVFRRGDRLVAHRLLFGCPVPAPGWFLQRGDGVSRTGVVKACDIVGVVTAVHLDGSRRCDLTTEEAHHHGLRTARRALYRLPLNWLTRALRKDRT